MARRAELLKPVKPARRPERVEAFSSRTVGREPRRAFVDRQSLSHPRPALETPLGEIDIVARRRGVLVFVEVKARASMDAALEAVTERTRQRIAAAAELWLARHPQHANGGIRFDVIVVTPGRMPRHIANAFNAGG